jgi:cytochrome P450
MNRKVIRSFNLSDGTTLPKGSVLMVAGKFRDPNIFKNPDTFDAARFLKLRATNAKSDTYQYVSTSAEMFGFGMFARRFTDGHRN